MLDTVKIERLRKASIKLMGGCCIACGCDDMNDMHIHHIEPIKTSSGRGQDRRAWEALRLAVEGGGLVFCAYCHGMFESKDRMLWMNRPQSQVSREAQRRALFEDFKGVPYWDVHSRISPGA